MKRIGAVTTLTLALFVVLVSGAAAEECTLEPRTDCFGLEAVDAALSAPVGSLYSATQAGAHPDLTFSFNMKQDPESLSNSFGLRDGFATPRDIRFELPPGLIGDPNVIGASQQCKAQELINFVTEGCPNGSQIGLSVVYAYELTTSYTEPVYMMQPPGGDVVARLGTIAGVFPTFVDLRVRSGSDYGLIAEVADAPAAARLVRLETTTWGVPAAESHDTERCTSSEVFEVGCVKSPSRPPGSLELPFMTNPTRCGTPLEMSVSASSWSAPAVFDTKTVSFPSISGCDKLPFGPSLSVEPTNHRAGAPTGLDVTIRQPAPQGVKVLEPAQTRYIRIAFPQGLALNTGVADGLQTCSAEQVGLEKPDASHCPDASKLADTEFEIPVLERRLKGAIYVREPEPGDPFRIWIVADDLGLHVKLPGQLEVDKQTGQIESIVVGTSQTEGIPQAPLREVKLEVKSGFRAPLVNPPACGTYRTDYEFTPWSGGPPEKNSTPMTISEDCDTGGFAPKLSAGTTDPAAGKHFPFLFTLTRSDGEQNPASLDISLPKGLAATFKGIPRCEGQAAATGQCPAASGIGHVIAAVGAGPAPLWIPQPGKRPTAVYLGGPYEGAPLSIVAVVPRQAGPFDFGDEVVRSAIDVDPVSAQATVRSDPLPQRIEGIPILYRTIHVAVDREGFTLNPTGCGAKQVAATVTSSVGGIATPSFPFRAANCASLGFRPKLSFRLFGGTHRGAHPRLRTVLTTRPGDANIAKTAVALPKSEFLDQGHIKTVCTRVQFAADQCPQGSIYGHARAISPLLDEPLKGPVYLRSSANPLPDVVIALHGLVDIEVPLRIDSVRGGIRATSSLIPDAPVTRFVLEMQGGRKGLLINSRNLCKAPAFADVDLDAHNGKSADQNPRMKVSCGKQGSTKHARHHPKRRGS
jgi:hypothetical protein